MPQTGLRVSGRKIGERGLLDADWGYLAGGDFSGETKGTGVFLATSRTYLCPFPNRYQAPARTATTMADARRGPIGTPAKSGHKGAAKLGMSF